MQREKISLEWLNQQLESLCVYNDVLSEKVLTFKNSLNNAALVLESFIKEHVKGRFTVLVVDPLKTNRHAIQFFERNGFEKLANYQSQSMYELLVLHVT